MRNRRSAQGFTIVELLIVIVVISILAAITIVTFSGVQERARFATYKADLANINKAIMIYHADNGTYPSPTPGRAGCTNGWCGWDQATGDDFIPGLSPKYIQALPQLPTSNHSNDTYLYHSTNGTEYRLMRYKTNDGGLSALERDGNPLSASPAFNLTGWGYKSNGINW